LIDWLTWPAWAWCVEEQQGGREEKEDARKEQGRPEEERGEQSGAIPAGSAPPR